MAPAYPYSLATELLAGMQLSTYLKVDWRERCHAAFSLFRFFAFSID